MIILKEELCRKVYVSAINSFFKSAYFSRLCLFIKWGEIINRVFQFYFNEFSSGTQITEFLANSFMTGLLFSAIGKVIFLRLGWDFFLIQSILTNKTIIFLSGGMLF